MILLMVIYLLLQEERIDDLERQAEKQRRINIELEEKFKVADAYQITEQINKQV